MTVSDENIRSNWSASSANRQHLLWKLPLTEVRRENSMAPIIAARSAFRSPTFSTPTGVYTHYLGFGRLEWTNGPCNNLRGCAKTARTLVSSGEFVKFRNDLLRRCSHPRPLDC